MAKSIVMSGGSNSLGFGITAYAAPGGGISFTGTEAYREAIFRESGTISNFFVRVSSNSYSGGDAVVTLRKNGADTAITVTITAGVSGIFEDTSNTVTVADGDTISVKGVATAPASGTAAYTVLAFQFEPDVTGDTTSYPSNSNLSSFATASVTRYHHLTQQTIQSTEAIVQTKASDSYTASHLSAYVSSNPRTTDVVFRFRINSANGNQLLTYTSGQTGRKTDTSNTDTIVSGDTFNYAIITSTGTGTLTTQSLHIRLVNTTANKWLFNVCQVSGIATNTTTHCSINGTSVTLGTEQLVEFRPRYDFTLANMRTYVSANTFTTLATTVTLRKSAADTALAISYAAGQTGWKEDLSDTVSVTGGTDTINYKFVAPNEAGSFTVRAMTVEGYTSAEDFIPRVIFM
jgi:hypothetical protein